MLEHDCGAIPVLDSEDDQTLVGVITDRDIVCRTLAQDKDPMSLLAGDCMTTPVDTVLPDAEVRDCIRLMHKRRIHRVLVSGEDGGCCGIVTQSDLRAYRTRQRPAQAVQDTPL